jgi:hypothetical protein
MCAFTEWLQRLVSSRPTDAADDLANDQEFPRTSGELRSTKARPSRLGELLIIVPPFLLGLVPILHLYAKNMYEAYFSIVMIFVAASMATTAVLFGAAWLWLRNASRAAVLVTVFNALFYSYGRLFDFLMQHEPTTLPYSTWHAVLLSFVATMLVAAVIYVARARVDYRPLNRFLSCMLAFALLFSVVKIVHHHARIALSQRNRLATFAAKAELPYVRVAPVNAEMPQTPDVYYIILDAYSRADTLERVCHFDNSEFVDFLKSRGFYVADQSCSNYPMTCLSIASSLNMRYLDDVLPPETSADNLSCFALWDRGLVARVFQSKGYRFVSFATNFKAKWDIVDIMFRLRPAWMQSEYSETLLRSTILRLFEPRIADQHLFEFESLKKVPEIEGPTFAFCHIIAPHPPYVFDRDGQVKRDIPQSMFVKDCWERNPLDDSGKQDYVDQTIYVNKRIEEDVDYILAHSKTRPIIIIQGDHGSNFTLPLPRENDGMDEFAAERLPILNAYYVPEVMRKRLTPDITPVNSFRLLFNTCFGEHFDILPEKHYIGWYDLEGLRDVTELVHPSAMHDHRAIADKPAAAETQQR